MSTIEKLNKQAEKDQERIDRLNAKMAEAEAAIMRDPDNDKAALEAAAASKQAQAARRALDNTLREIEAEKGRMYEQEVKAAHNELAEIEKQVIKIREVEAAKMSAFYVAYQEWADLVNKHASIARQYGIDAPSLLSLDQGSGGMHLMEYALNKWREGIAAIKVSQQSLNH